MQNTVDRLSTACYYINEDRSYKKLNKEEHLMKKRISFTLALLLILSVCILPFATHGDPSDNVCAIGGHEITASSPVVSVSDPSYSDKNDNTHYKYVTTVRCCSCGEKTKPFVTTTIESHSSTTSTSPHSNGGHYVTTSCGKCNHVSDRYFYKCPGGTRCIYPASIEEIY